MSKFFVQILLSLMVGTSAVLGLSPNVRSELREAKGYLQGRINVIVENVREVSEDIDTGISAKTDARVSAENGDAAKVKVTNTLNVKGSSEGSLFDSGIPALSTDGSLSSKTQTNVETDGSNVEVELKEKIKSAFNLELGD